MGVPEEDVTVMLSQLAIDRNDENSEELPGPNADRDVVGTTSTLQVS
jgi:hypothetical protein